MWFVALATPPGTDFWKVCARGDWRKLLLFGSAVVSVFFGFLITGVDLYDLTGQLVGAEAMVSAARNLNRT